MSSADLDGRDPEVRARKIALRFRERAEERKAAGLCTCGRAREEGSTRTLCSMCRAKHAARAQIRPITSRKATTISLRDLVRQDLDLHDPELPQRPRTRGECVDGPRPCPWFGCRFHLGLDVKPNGSIVLRELGADSCALDVADRGGATLDVVGEMLGVTRERARQLELIALRMLRRSMLRDAP